MARGAVQRLEGLSIGVNKVVAIIASGSILAIMMLVVVDVSGRYLFNKPITGGIEAEQIILSYLEFLPLAYALIVGAHLRVTLVLDRLGRRLQICAELLAGLLGLIFFVLLTWGSWEHFWESWVAKEYMPSAVGIPFWLPKLGMPVGMALMSFQFLVYFLTRMTQFTEKQEE